MAEKINLTYYEEFKVEVNLTETVIHFPVDVYEFSKEIKRLVSGSFLIKLRSAQAFTDSDWFKLYKWRLRFSCSREFHGINGIRLFV